MSKSKERRDRLRELCQGTLDAMDAHERGEAVEYSPYGTNWSDADPPEWHSNLFYRPKPYREFWVNITPPDILGILHRSKSDAVRVRFNGDETICLREVTE